VSLRSVKDLMLMANVVREYIIEMFTEAKSGHTAGPLGMTDIFIALYFDVMNHDPRDPKWVKRDRLILSNGHICPILYSCLARSGYFPVSELETLRQINSRLQGHPHYGSLPGVENSSGPLGQGISFGVGTAYGLKMDKNESKVFLMMSDGELQEGQSWEAFMFAAKHKLDNIIGVVDRNYIQIGGNTEKIMPLDPLKDKFLAFNWDVVEVDGNNMKDVVRVLRKARNHKGKPLVIIARTMPGEGVSFIEGKYQWHGKPPSEKQESIGLNELTNERLRLIGMTCPKCNKIKGECKC